MTTMMTLRDVKQNLSPGHDHACSSKILEEISMSLWVIYTYARCKCLSFPLLAMVHFRVSLPSLNLAPLVFVVCLSCRLTEATTCGEFGRRTGPKSLMHAYAVRFAWVRASVLFVAGSEMRSRCCSLASMARITVETYALAKPRETCYW
jgi:hypothetical protein